AAGARDGMRGRGAGRMDHADPPGARGAAVYTLVRTRGMLRKRVLLEPAGGHTKRAHRLSRQRFVDLQNLVTTSSCKRPPTFTEDFELAAREQHVRRSLGEDDA